MEICRTFMVILFCNLSFILPNETSEFRHQNKDENRISFKCSCMNKNQSIIIQNESIILDEKKVMLSENVNKLWVGNCASVHLSGKTLSLVSKLERFTIHNANINLAVEFLQQYSSNLRSITLSSCTLGSLESSLDLYIHRLSDILIQNCEFREQLNILIRTQENHVLDSITIKNCTIDTLGQINLSQRKVKKFSLINSKINHILPSTILHDTETTAIYGNLLGSVDFLAMEINTLHFTLKGNSINSIARHALIVNNASIIQIESNIFRNIEKQAFLRLLPQMTENGHISGTLIFSNNHFHCQQPDSLIFYWRVYDSLEIANNYFYTESCKCSAVMKFLHKMIEGTTKMYTFNDVNLSKAFKMFRDTSYCQEKSGKTLETSQFIYNTEFCDTSNEFGQHSGALIIIVILIFLALILGGLFLRECLRRRIYGIQNKNNEQTWELISTETPVNDSESDE